MLDRLKELRSYAPSSIEEEIEQLDGWELRVKGPLDAINEIDAMPLQ